MKQLTCEMCGGTDLLKQEGVFVCQTCGCKYSVEEAKKMMVEGTVRIDESSKIDNYYTMAETAYKADNKQEAENYCNKIIEIEPTNYKAWLLKGKAAGWQSTGKKQRLEESLAAFDHAISNAPEGERQSVWEEAEEEIEKLSIAFLSLKCDFFKRFPDDEIEDVLSAIKTIKELNIAFIIQQGFKDGIDHGVKDKSTAKLVDWIAITVLKTVHDAYFNKIWIDYENPNNPDDKPNKNDFDRYRKCVGNCIDLLAAVDVESVNGEIRIKCLEQKIGLWRAGMDACAWDYKFVNGHKQWYKSFWINDEFKNKFRDYVTSDQNKISEIRAELRKIEEQKRSELAKKSAEYWTAHADEKATLDQEKENLKNQVQVAENALAEQIVALKKQVTKTPAEEDDAIALRNEQLRLTSLENEIVSLQKEKDSLGMFKGKEKKVLQEKIERQEEEKNSLSIRVKELQDRYDAVSKRIGAQNKETDEKIASLRAEVIKKNAPLKKRMKEIDDLLQNPPLEEKE